MASRNPYCLSAFSRIHWELALYSGNVDFGSSWWVHCWCFRFSNNFLLPTGINECNEPSLSGCDQNCTDTLTSFYCSCRPGYKLMSDKRTCSDIDECKETPFVCSQKCENIMGSYICKCAPGYIREPDGKSCRQNSNIEPYLIFSNRYYLRNLTIDGSFYSLILQGLGNAVALDFDRVEKRLYWIDIEKKVIERMFLNKTSRETVLKHRLPAAESLAVDWVARWENTEEFIKVNLKKKINPVFILTGNFQLGWYVDTFNASAWFFFFFFPCCIPDTDMGYTTEPKI